MPTLFTHPLVPNRRRVRKIFLVYKKSQKYDKSVQNLLYICPSVFYKQLRQSSILNLAGVYGFKRQLVIFLIFFSKHSYPTALELVASGKVNLKPLVTNRFKLEESHKAFTTSSSPGCNTIKVMISCHEE